jgi:hypothetical protein
MRSIQKKKALLATGIASASLAGILLVGGVAFAQTGAQPNGGLAQAIASKFNLNKDDVQKVIDTQHQDMLKQHLDKLVSEGKITAEQETKIIAKLADEKPKVEAARALTDSAARKQAMDAIHTEMQQWEKDNNIPAGVIGPMGGRGHKMMGGMQAPPNDGGTANN